MRGVLCAVIQPVCLSPAAPPPPSLVTLQCVEWATVLCGFALCVDCDQELLLISVPPPVAALHHHCYHRAWNVGIVYVPELTCTVRGVLCCAVCVLACTITNNTVRGVCACLPGIPAIISCCCRFYVMLLYISKSGTVCGVGH